MNILKDKYLYDINIKIIKNMLNNLDNYNHTFYNGDCKTYIPDNRIVINKKDNVINE
jgi:hypothetical protein